MKKSEMLQKLYEATDRYYNDEKDQNFVDFLLNECLELGMLPPYRKVEGKTEHPYWSNSWEEENEKAL